VPDFGRLRRPRTLPLACGRGASSGDGACVHERAEVLNRVGSDTELGCCLPGRQSGPTSLTNAFREVGGYRGTPELLALGPGPPQADTDALLNYPSLEFGKPVPLAGRLCGTEATISQKRDA
jgi:hypothetical protein